MLIFYPMICLTHLNADQMSSGPVIRDIARILKINKIWSLQAQVAKLYMVMFFCLDVTKASLTDHRWCQGCKDLTVATW